MKIWGLIFLINYSWKGVEEGDWVTIERMRKRENFYVKRKKVLIEIEGRWVKERCEKERWGGFYIHYPRIEVYFPIKKKKGIKIGIEEVVDYKFENESKIKDENQREIGEMKIKKEGGGYVYTGVLWKELQGRGKIQIGGEILKMVEKERKREIYYQGERKNEVKEISEIHYRIRVGIILKKGEIEVSLPCNGEEIFPLTIEGSFNYHSVFFPLKIIKDWGWGWGFLNLYEIKEKIYLRYGGWVFNFKNEWGSNFILGGEKEGKFFEIVIGRKEYYKKIPWYLKGKRIETSIVLVMLGSYVSI